LSGCSISNINQNILSALKRLKIVEYDRQNVWLVGYG